MSKDIYVIFGFDMETDVGSFTPYYDGVKNATTPLLDIYDKKEITGTFFYTGDAAEKNPNSVKEVLARGHEVGCHSLMHETVGDPLFPIPLEISLLPEEVHNRLEKATELIEKVSGIRPTTFRSPRLWGSTSVVNSLEELGYIADASYPMYFYRERFAPYYPSRKDWTKEGNSKVLEIPNFADMVMESSDGDLGRDRDQWPLFRTHGAEYLLEKVKKHIQFLQSKDLPIVLCFYFHPWEFIELKNEYYFGECTIRPDKFITNNCGDKAYVEFEKLIDGLLEIGGKFYRVDEFAEFWKERG
ncbi:polysaccharide deacetylase family protein [Virgibacillus sp. W0430]|uniref:polysaccharide deacetylase family protein n=1 Tax=Virgibacillus sp. W0430 TaxID=3391580 RepID=UPI003F45761E